MKTKMNKCFAVAGLAAMVMFSLSSCKKDKNDNPEGSNVSLSFVNTVEGSSAQDVYVNDSKASSSAVAYGSAATEISTSSGSKMIAFKNSGSATVTASTTINVNANSSQTVFLVKQSNGSMALSTHVNDNTTTSGKVRVRFINVAPLLTAAVNVATSTGTSLISALQFQAASAYQTIDANTSLNINMTGSAEVTTIAGSELQAGKTYTIWLDAVSSTKVKYHIILQK